MMAMACNANRYYGKTYNILAAIMEDNYMSENVNSVVTVKDIVKYISGLAGGLGKEEGIRFGIPTQPVKIIQLCWMANVAAIKNAAQIGADLIVAHESILYPFSIFEQSGPPDYLGWHTNHNRIDLLAKYNISVVRAHITLDRLCIFDDFAASLGLGDPVVEKPEFVKIYEIEPMPYGKLINLVKEKLGLDCLRATPGNKDRLIRRIGLPWGGLGLILCTTYLQKLLNEDCDCFIAGETDNYGFHFATDAGIDLIETSHEISENPGLKHFSGTFSQAFPDLEVIFYENTPPFVYE